MMASWLLSTLLVLPANAGLLDQMDAGDIQMAVCKQAADDARYDPERRLGVWKACLDECERKGLDSIIQSVRGELALAAAAAEAALFVDLTAEQRLEHTLVEIAMQRDITFPLSTLGSLLRDYLLTDTGRSRMEDCRSLTFCWTNRHLLKEDEVRRVNAVMRRYVEEASRVCGSERGSAYRREGNGRPQEADKAPQLAPRQDGA